MKTCCIVYGLWSCQDAVVQLTQKYETCNMRYNAHRKKKHKSDCEDTMRYRGPISEIAARAGKITEQQLFEKEPNIQGYVRWVGCALHDDIAVSTPSCHLLCTMPGKERVPVLPAVRLACCPTACNLRCSCNQSFPRKCNVLAAQLFWFRSLPRCSFQFVTLFRQRALQQPRLLASSAAARLRLLTNASGSSSGLALRFMRILIILDWVLSIRLALCI